MKDLYEDKELVCLCGESFVWTAGEQEFLDNLAMDGKIPSVKEPKRCPTCRQKRKAERERLNNQDYPRAPAWH